MAHHSPVVAVPSQTGTDYHFSALGRTNIMLAELVDHVIGVDPDKDWITAAIVDTKTTGVVDTARFSAWTDARRRLAASRRGLGDRWPARPVTRRPVQVPTRKRATEQALQPVPNPALESASTVVRRVRMI